MLNLFLSTKLIKSFFEYLKAKNIIIIKIIKGKDISASHINRSKPKLFIRLILPITKSKIGYHIILDIFSISNFGSFVYNPQGPLSILEPKIKEGINLEIAIIIPSIAEIIMDTLFKINFLLGLNKIQATPNKLKHVRKNIVCIAPPNIIIENDKALIIILIKRFSLSEKDANIITAVKG